MEKKEELVRSSQEHHPEIVAAAAVEEALLRSVAIEVRDEETPEMPKKLRRTRD